MFKQALRGADGVLGWVAGFEQAGRARGERAERLVWLASRGLRPEGRAKVILMRFDTRVALAAAVLCSTSHASADPGSDGTPCPMSPTQVEAELVRDRIAIGLYDAPLRRGGPDILVPLTFHIVRQSDGSGGLTAQQAHEALDVANDLWMGSGIQFCAPGEVFYIDSDEYHFETDTTTEINTLRMMNQVPDTINVYFVNNLRSELGALCGISSFTFSTYQGIAISNSCTPAAGNPSTFAHELAHYFDLYHTHERAFGDECTDGSNCLIAGDLVCDTPADPNIAGEVNPAFCEWGGNEEPPCIVPVPYDPSPRNLLSYSSKTCRDELTPGQLLHAYATLVNLRPELVANGCDPCTNPADMNGDDTISPADFSAWVGAYNAGQISADQNGDGSLSPADFSAWVANYNLGC